MSVKRFCRQYLQLELSLDFPAPELLREEATQDEIYNVFTTHPQPPVRYRLRTLKELIKRIESSIDDWDSHAISDGLMGALSELLASPLPPEDVSEQRKCYVTYHLSALGKNITLLEKRALLAAGGTTGLRTWEAALHLGHYLCTNPSLIAGKRVLELGTGTGFLSVLCARYLSATHVLASDGSDDVISNLPENLFLNGLQGLPLVSPMDLKWGHALVGTEEASWNGGRPVDVVIGADVTYDAKVIPALVGTLVEVLEMFPDAEAYISATQRNEATFGTFLDSCRGCGLDVEDLQVEVPPGYMQTGPFYNDQVAIRLCRVRRS